MTTTKKDLALVISEKLGVRKQLAYEVVDTLFKAMRESLISGDRIEIRGFGVLGVKDTKPKPAARNPRTGEIVYVPARKKSYFKAGVLIKKALHEPLDKTSQGTSDGYGDGSALGASSSSFASQPSSSEAGGGEGGPSTTP